MTIKKTFDTVLVRFTVKRFAKEIDMLKTEARKSKSIKLVERIGDTLALHLT